MGFIGGDLPRKPRLWYHGAMLPTPSLRPPRRPAWAVLLPALWGPVAVLLLSLRLALLPPLRWAAGDPALPADGFYALETGADGVPLRWSRPSAGFLVPALAARQVVTLELATPRTAGQPPPRSLMLEANGAGTAVPGTPGWADVAVTAPSQIGLANAVALVASGPDDSFYPGAGDRRQLTATVRAVRLGWPADVAGLPLPAPLPGVAALLLPGLIAALLRWRAGVGAAVTVAAIAGAAWLLPITVLPTVLTVAGVGAALTLALRLLLAYGPALEAGAARVLADPRWGRGREWGGLTLAYSVLAAVATWPLVTRLTTAVPGWPGDNFAFLYKIWWVRHALTGGHDLFRDPTVFYPFGFNFGRGEPTLPNTLPGAALALLGGDAFGYNMMLLGGFVLSGLATYGLARAGGAGRAGAALAGVAFMLAPYRLGQAAGHLQIAATQWIPLTLWCAERALRGRRGAAALTGLCFGLTALTAWYYAIIGGLLLAGYVGLRAIGGSGAGDRRPRLDDQGSAARRPSIQKSEVSAQVLSLLRPLAAFALVAGLVIAPGLAPALGAAGEAPLTHSAKAADENSASLADYVLPQALQPLWGQIGMRARLDENIIESALYVGLPALGLAILALWPRRGAGGRWDRRAGIWAVLASGCLLLSLGLTLRVLPGEAVRLGGQPLSLPARLLFDWVPGFNSLRAYARFGVGVALAGAILAGLGLTRLWVAPRLRRRRVPLAAGLLALVLTDLWSAPNAWGLTAIAPDAVAGWLAAQPPGAVMRLPPAAAIAGPPLYMGTAYGRPLAYGYETFEPPGFRAARPALLTFPKTAAFTQLRAWGVRYVVVAASSYGADWPATRAYFATLPAWTPVYQAAEPRRYQAPFWLGDVQPDLTAAFAPDELMVYRLR